MRSAVCTLCQTQASLSEHNLRAGWSCPSCAQSHWPAGDGWTASSAPGPASPNESVASLIHPTRAAAPGWAATQDLLTRPGLSSSARVRVASILCAGAAVLVAVFAVKSALGW